MSRRKQYILAIPVALSAAFTTGSFAAPVASFSVIPNPAAPNQVLTFNASSSFSEDTLHGLVRYEWDYDYGGYENSFQISALGRIGYHAYARFGAFSAALKVWDDLGAFAITSTIINVSQGNHTPVAYAQGPYVTTLGDALALTGNWTDADITAGDWASSEWSIYKSGGPSLGTFSGDSPTLPGTLFTSPGLYTALFTVTDMFGATASSESTIQVNNVAVIPEPETYAMLLAGLGLLGFMAKRRKLKEAAAA